MEVIRKDQMERERVHNIAQKINGSCPWAININNDISVKKLPAFTYILGEWSTINSSPKMN